MSAEFDPQNPKSYAAPGGDTSEAFNTTNDDGPGFGRSHQHPTTGTVHREVDQVKPAEYENGTTIEGSNGLDAAHARENGVDEDPSSEQSGHHFVHNGSTAGEDALNPTGIGHGPAAAALGRTGYDSLTHGHEHPSSDVDPDPSHTYARGTLPPPNDGKVNIGGNPENPREAMAYEPHSQTGSSAHETQRKGLDDSKLDPDNSSSSGQRKVSDDSKLDLNNSSPSDQKKGSDDPNDSSPSGHVHPGGSTGGGVSDKFVGKIQHAAGVLFHNENMKAKGTEKETRATKKGSVDEAEYLQQEEQVKKERAGSGNVSNLDRKKMAGQNLV